MEGKRPEESRVTLTLVMGQEHANFLGNVHGGVIMKLCDEAGGMAASKHARRHVVTVTVDSMHFHNPVHIGQLLTVEAEVSWVGRTSLETRVAVRAENVIKGEITHTNTAYFVYVALGDDGRPIPVPPLLCETEAQKSRFARAEVRRAFRLQQSHHDKT